MTSAGDSDTPPPPPSPPPTASAAGAFLTYLLGLAGALGLAGLLAPIMRYAYPVVTATSLRSRRWPR